MVLLLYYLWSIQMKLHGSGGKKPRLEMSLKRLQSDWSFQGSAGILWAVLCLPRKNSSKPRKIFAFEVAERPKSSISSAFHASYWHKNYKSGENFSFLFSQDSNAALRCTENTPCNAALTKLIFVISRMNPGVLEHQKASPVAQGAGLANVPHVSDQQTWENWAGRRDLLALLSCSQDWWRPHL